MDYFGNLELFSSLTPTDRQQLSSFCQMRTLKRGDILIREGEEASSMYLIVSWEFSVEKKWEYKNTLWAGDIVWEIAFLEKRKPRNATITCVEQWVIVAIIEYAMSEMLEKHPDLHSKIQGIISSRQD